MYTIGMGVMVMADKRELIRKQFGKRLTELLSEKNISQYQLAQECGIDRGAISKYITGERAPQMDAFLTICDELQVSPNYFIDAPKTDYVSDTSKSEAWKLIESLFFLYQEGKIDSFEEYYGPSAYRNENDPDYILLINGQVLSTVLEEIKRYSGSNLVEEENICEKICQKYEKNLEEEMQAKFLKVTEISSDDLPF
jgi:transcriptional regulator with XRE-family HTH domain